MTERCQKGVKKACERYPEGLEYVGKVLFESFWKVSDSVQDVAILRPNLKFQLELKSCSLLS